MARPSTGSIQRKPTRRGIVYGLQYTFHGERLYERFGGEWEGWDDERAENRRRAIALLIERGEWIPTPPRPASPAPRDGDVTLRDYVAGYLARRQERVGDGGLTQGGLDDLKWKLETAIDFIGSHPMRAIDHKVVDDELVGAALKERRAIEEAAKLGAPLTETVTDRRGRTYERKRRGLSRGSINKVLAGLNLMFRDAVRRGDVDSNPVDPESRVRAHKPQRSYLQALQILAALDAAALLEAERRGLTWQKVHYIRFTDKSAVNLAKELGISDVTIGKVRRGLIWVDEQGPRRRNDIARRATMAVLVLAGLRVSECCGLLGRHVDLAAGVIRVPRDATKSDAGERVIPIVPRLRELLIEHRATFPYGPDDFVFATRNGTRNAPDNVRTHVIGPVLERANELLVGRGQEPIGHLTPHTLRRTFASILAEVGVQPRRAMYLLGHTNAKFTMAVYQQVLDVHEVAIDALHKCLGATLDEALVILSGRASHGGFCNPIATRPEKKPSEPVDLSGWEG